MTASGVSEMVITISQVKRCHMTDNNNLIFSQFLLTYRQTTAVGECLISCKMELYVKMFRNFGFRGKKRVVNYVTTNNSVTGSNGGSKMKTRYFMQCYSLHLKWVLRSLK